MRELISQKKEEGFTLIELLIVIIILAVLAAIVVFAVGSTSSNAKISACNADAKSVETAIEAYKAQLGTFPGAIGNLTTSAVGGNGDTTGPWLRQIPRANTSDDGYAISYASGNVSIVLSGTTMNYDGSVTFNGSTNPCDSAGK